MPPNSTDLSGLRLRLAQAYVYASDAASEKPLAKSKGKALRELLTSTVDLAQSMDVSLELEAHQAPTSITAVKKCATAARKDLRALRDRPGDVDTAFTVEFVAGTRWPGRQRWTSNRWALMAKALKVAGADCSEEHLFQIGRAYRRACKRLSRDSTSPVTQVTFGAAVLTLSVATGGTGGPVAQAVGTSIGTHLFGLSGAAATSAGMAWLGGGSIAAGGFGMAGGALLVNHATTSTVRIAGRSLMSALARSSADLMIQELAKLDTLCFADPKRKKKVIAELKALKSRLKREHHAIHPAKHARATTVGKAIVKTAVTPGSSGRALKKVWESAPDREERTLAKSIRAVDFEIRHLSSPTWKRRVQKATRMTGMPVASKAFDRL